MEANMVVDICTKYTALESPVMLTFARFVIDMLPQLLDVRLEFTMKTVMSSPCRRTIFEIKIQGSPMSLGYKKNTISRTLWKCRNLPFYVRAFDNNSQFSVLMESQWAVF